MRVSFARWLVIAGGGAVLTALLAAPLAAQPVLRPVAVARAEFSGQADALPGIAARSPSLLAGDLDSRRMPRWVRWGLIGAAAGAVTFPLLGSMASDSEARPARDAAAGALVGFVIIGGSIALWDAVCAGDTRSRRAGLCGNR